MSRVIEADCIEAMAAMPESSIDAIVTDPPYGLGFMGKAWDGLPPGLPWAQECLRVLKPGGHLLAFGGTRTYHRLTCAIEDAGFEIRDCLAWLYGSGFPKSLDVSKAMDKAAGADREVVGPDRGRLIGGANGASTNHGRGGIAYGVDAPTAPATPEADQWNGWGTALKPAHEPIVMARKPLTGTVAANVLEHGTGALNVDGCRIEGPASDGGSTSGETALGQGSGWNAHANRPTEIDRSMAAGRWPANVLLDPEAAALLDEQTGNLLSQDPATRRSDSVVKGVTGFSTNPQSVQYADSGGASRFFYVAKASRAERNAGLDGFEERERREGLQNCTPRSMQINEAMGRPVPMNRNVHPTVKPIALMRWLCRLVTPPGGLILDPFTGSGTTGCAAVLEDFDFIGIEREAEYVAIARARIAHWREQPVQLGLEAA